MKVNGDIWICTQISFSENHHWTFWTLPYLMVGYNLKSLTKEKKIFLAINIKWFFKNLNTRLFISYLSRTGLLKAVKNRCAFVKDRLCVRKLHVTQNLVENISFIQSQGFLCRFCTGKCRMYIKKNGAVKNSIARKST